MRTLLPHRQEEFLNSCAVEFRPLLRRLVELVGPSVGQVAPKFSLDEFLDVLQSAIHA